jgi:hypothetical protein
MISQYQDEDRFQLRRIRDNYRNGFFWTWANTSYYQWQRANYKLLRGFSSGFKDLSSFKQKR